MIKNPYYTLLVNQDCCDNIDLEGLNSVFTCAFGKKDARDDVLYDVILDADTLELHHAFNKEFILKLNNLTDINGEVKDEIISEIKRMDFDTSLAVEMLGGSEKVFKGVLANYLVEYEDIEDAINKFFDNEDFDSIRKIIHKIKGVSLYLGSEKLLYLTTEIENKIYGEVATKSDIYSFINYHNRMLEYVRNQV